MVFFRPDRVGYADDPYPELARLRAAEPVHWSANLGAWIVTSFAECERVMLDAETFAADPAAEGGTPGERVAAHRRSMPLGEAAILGHADGAEHSRLRGAVGRAFGARAIAVRDPEVRELVEALLGRQSSRQPFELMGGLAQPLAAMTAMRHIGLPQDRWDGFHRAAVAVMHARVNGLADPGAAAEAEAGAAFILEGLAETPDGSERESLAGMVAAAVDAGEVTPEEAVMLLVHIGLAGNGPTAMALGTAAWALARHPEWLDALATGRVRAEAVVEEALRWDSPTHVVPRFATRDVRLADKTVRGGQRLMLMIGSANRDPARFSEPDRFDPRREGPRHLSFGVGPHYCLGAPLARAELAIALDALVERLGRFQVVEARRASMFVVRGFERLVVVPSGIEVEG